jgi:hypothetical protein
VAALQGRWKVSIEELSQASLFGREVNATVETLELGAIVGAQFTDYFPAHGVLDGTVQTTISGLKVALEGHERMLRKAPAPRPLRKFRANFLKAIRGIILGHGSLRNKAGGSARFFYSLAETQLSEASEELRRLRTTDERLFASLNLSARSTALLLSADPAPIEEASGLQDAVASDSLRTPKFCSNCGSPLGRGFRFCNACGEKIQAP